MAFPGGQAFPRWLMRIWLDLELNLIQEIRLAHAIAEAGLQVCLSPRNRPRVAEVTRTFGTPFSFQTEGLRSLAGVQIDHATPRTTVGKLHRPLIFPHAIGEWTRQRWPIRRDVDYSFCGLMTQSRHGLLEAWLRQHGYAKPLRPRNMSALFDRLLRRVRTGSSACLSADTDIGRVAITSSSGGRTFPGKSWDEPYFQTLLRANYAICPNGDYVWTYRFFEAILCGAIPVVQDACPQYEGFRYGRLDDRPPPWSIELATSNFELCLERITVPQESIRDEVERLATDGDGQVGGDKVREDHLVSATHDRIL